MKVTIGKATLTTDQPGKAKDHMKTRTIIDGGGYPRKMKLIYEKDGTTIYKEDPELLCVFWEYDSLDISGNWFEGYEKFIRSRPDDEKEDWKDIKG